MGGVTRRLISDLQYKTLLSQQDGLCAICSREQTGKRKNLAVDHDHNSGNIRGLLCRGCNTGLGSFEENIFFLKSAIDYLLKYKTFNKKTYIRYKKKNAQ